MTQKTFMKTTVTSSLIAAILFLTVPVKETAQAQTVDLLGGNVLNGAVTGTMLGIGVMGLQNSDDFSPLRVGLGAGILGGASIALYDVATLPQGQQFFISGIFNDGNNSSIIILLDTMYGAAGGAVLGSAVMLIQDEPIVDGLRYGGGIGVWAGFGLGLIDAFLIAERNQDFVAESILNRSSLLEMKAGEFDIGIGEPTLYRTVDAGQGSLSYDLNPGVKLFSLSRSF